MSGRPAATPGRLIGRANRALQRYPRTLHGLTWVLRFVRLIVRQLVRDDCLVKAGSLAFSTLLSIVPLIAVSLMVLRLSGAFATVENQVRDVLVQFLVAESVNSVAAYLTGFMSRASSGTVGGVGLAFLVVTGLLLFFEAETDVNNVWRVHRGRPLLARLATFFSLLLLGPLLLGLGLFIRSEITEASGKALIEPLRLAVNFLVSAGLLTVMYKLIPATPVRWRPAAVAGLTAAALFEASRALFNLYVGALYAGSTNAVIYGAFGLLPVFLLWLYLFWILFLVGVEIAYTVQNLDALYDEALEARLPDTLHRRNASAYLAARVALLVAYRHHRKQAPLTYRDLIRALRVPESAVESTVSRLVEGGVLLEAPAGVTHALVPARELDRITLYDVIHAYRAHEPQPYQFPALPALAVLDDLFCDLEIRRHEVAAAFSLADLLETVRPELLERYLLPPHPGSGSAEDRTFSGPIALPPRGSGTDPPR
jgi:membrane protein